MSNFKGFNFCISFDCVLKIDHEAVQNDVFVCVAEFL